MSYLANMSYLATMESEAALEASEIALRALRDPHGYEWMGQYVLRARGGGPEYEECEYQFFNKYEHALVSYPPGTTDLMHPTKWAVTHDLTGLVSELGMDLSIHLWGPRTFMRFHNELDKFREGAYKVGPVPGSWIMPCRGKFDVFGGFTMLVVKWATRLRRALDMDVRAVRRLLLGVKRLLLGKRNPPPWNGQNPHRTRPRWWATLAHIRARAWALWVSVSDRGMQLLRTQGCACGPACTLQNN